MTFGRGEYRYYLFWYLRSLSGIEVERQWQLTTYFFSSRRSKHHTLWLLTEQQPAMIVMLGLILFREHDTSFISESVNSKWAVLWHLFTMIDWWPLKPFTLSVMLACALLLIFYCLTATNTLLSTQSYYFGFYLLCINILDGLNAGGSQWDAWLVIECNKTHSGV